MHAFCWWCTRCGEVPTAWDCSEWASNQAAFHYSTSQCSSECTLWQESCCSRIEGSFLHSTNQFAFQTEKWKSLSLRKSSTVDTDPVGLETKLCFPGACCKKDFKRRDCFGCAWSRAFLHHPMRYFPIIRCGRKATCSEWHWVGMGLHLSALRGISSYDAIVPLKMVQSKQKWRQLWLRPWTFELVPGKEASRMI